MNGGDDAALSYWVFCCLNSLTPSCWSMAFCLYWLWRLKPTSLNIQIRLILERSSRPELSTWEKSIMPSTAYSKAVNLNLTTHKDLSVSQASISSHPADRGGVLQEDTAVAKLSFITQCYTLSYKMRFISLMHRDSLKQRYNLLKHRRTERVYSTEQGTHPFRVGKKKEYLNFKPEHRYLTLCFLTKWSLWFSSDLICHELLFSRVEWGLLAVKDDTFFIHLSSHHLQCSL